MSSLVGNGDVRMEESSVPTKTKKVRKSLPSGMMVIRKKELQQNIHDKTGVKGNLNMEKEVEEQIFNGPMPPYRPTVAPPMPPSGSDIPIEPQNFFTCNDCGDRFLFQSSLTMHLSRKSVKISLWRPGVSEPKIFYNRCKLLASLRQQMGPSSGISARISIEPLDKEHVFLGITENHPVVATTSTTNSVTVEKTTTSKKFCKILPKITTVSNTETKLVSQTPVDFNNKLSDIPMEIDPPALSNNPLPPCESVTNSDQVQENGDSLLENVTSPEETPSDCDSEEDRMVIDEESDTGELVTDKCPECNIKLTIGTNLKQHFAHKNIKSSKFKCNKCQIFLPSNCSLKSHQHLHSSTLKENKTFICPECGIKFIKWESFFRHLHNVCMHAYYSECFMCQNCSNMFPSSISLEVHILKTHIKKVYKCYTCNVACYSLDALHKHFEDEHDNKRGRFTVFEMCQLCPGRLISKSCLLFHVHQHAEDRTNAMFCYVCEPCSVYVEKKEDFIDHKKICTKTVSHLVKSTILESVTNNISTDMLVSPVNGKNTVITKPDSKANIVKKKNNDKIRSTSPKVSIKACHKCGNLLQLYKYKKYACFSCNKSLLKKMNRKKCNAQKSLSLENCSNDNSIKKEHVDREENNINYRCPLCSLLTRNDCDAIKEHFGDNHEELYHKVDWCSENYKEDIKSFLNNQEVENGDVISCKFKCKICDLQTDEESEFREHVVTHRPGQSTAFQCMECGMCYVVKPSLEKHLLLTHKIKGVDDYLRDSGQNIDEELGIQGPPLKENQCKVCYQEFQSVQELNTHLRTHGLAFLLNKRGSDLLRSP